jgi:hypothetical protein
MLVEHASLTRRPLSQLRVGGVEALSGEQEGAQLAPVHAAALGGVDLWTPDVLGGVLASAVNDRCTLPRQKEILNRPAGIQGATSHCD